MHYPLSNCGALSAFGLVALLALSSPAWAGASAQDAPQWGAYADVQAEAWSNGLPVLKLDGDWSRGYDRREGPQRAYMQARVEFGGQFRPATQGGDIPWRLGVLARADASARASGEAAQVLYHYQSRTDPSQPVTYNADTDIQFWSGQGLALHTPMWRWHSLSLGASWDHMSLRRLRSLQTAGQVSYHNDGSYGFLGTLRDDDARSTHTFVAPPDKTGQGDALSLRLQWQREPADEVASASRLAPTLVSIDVDDAWSRLQWRGVNGNDAVLDSNVSQRTPDGYIEYRAAINGQYTRRTLLERIPTSTQVRLDWLDTDGGGWFIRAKTRLGLWQRWLGWQNAGAWRWQVEVEPVAGALAVGMSWRGLSLSLMGDRLDDAAHACGARLSWAVLF